MSISKKLRAHGWLIVINALIAMAISSRYFAFLPEFPTDALGRIFIITGTFSHMAMLAGLFGLLLLPILLLPDNVRRIVQSGGAAFGLVLLFVDTIVFAQYRFHINAVVLDLLLSGDVVSFPLSTWLIVTGAIVTLWFSQWHLIIWLEKKLSIRQKFGNRQFALMVLISFTISSLIHIWASAHAYQSVTSIKRYLPSYYPLSANKMMRKIGWINEKEVQRQKELTLSKKRDIRYPLESLETESVPNPLNIVIIVIDSWRYDTFNANNTPNLWEFSQQGAIFNHHLSTGNSTRSGIFGLFYGIPATYWEAMLANHSSPVLMERLAELNYQFGIFASAHLINPEFNRTVFANIPNLREESDSKTPASRDLEITNEWLEWNSSADQQYPKFSFLFYDAAHGYDFPADYPHRYEPLLDSVNYIKLNNNTDPIPFLNRYKTSIHYIDSLAKKVLDNLKQRNELDNTLVVITGDHSQEMNDNKQNFWGHGSNFSYAQVQVPFAMVGPKIDELGFKATNEFSDHQNLAPTLLHAYLGVTSAIETYSTGRSFFSDAQQRQWVIAGNFNGYALVSQEQILEIDASGQYSILDREYRPSKEAKLDTTKIQEAIEMMSRFNH